jgi:hypothetical protein
LPPDLSLKNPSSLLTTGRVLKLAGRRTMYAITRIFYDLTPDKKRLKKRIRKLVRQRNRLAFRLNRARGRRRR